MALGLNVKRLRIRAGLTQAELAELVGLDQAAISALERRDSRSSTYASALARALNTSTDELLTGEIAEKPEEAEVAMINPAELSELITHYTQATDIGRQQLLRAARNIEKPPGLQSPTAENR